MSKKVIIILSIIGVLIIGGIVGILCYKNTPGYVMKQYVKTINNGQYNKLQKYEYNYKNYKIISSIDYYKDNGWSDDIIMTKTHISDYKLHTNHDKNIENLTRGTILFSYNLDIGNNYKDISDIKVYDFTSDFNLLNRLNVIMVGKVNGRWKVVYSPYYYLE